MLHTAETNQAMSGGIKPRRQSYCRGNEQAFDEFCARYNQLRAVSLVPLRAVSLVPLRAVSLVPLKAVSLVPLKALL
jgi:hypothetical protein